jgi:hypothetical protein
MMEEEFFLLAVCETRTDRHGTEERVFVIRTTIIFLPRRPGITAPCATCSLGPVQLAEGAHALAAESADTLAMRCAEARGLTSLAATSPSV